MSHRAEADPGLRLEILQGALPLLSCLQHETTGRHATKIEIRSRDRAVQPRWLEFCFSEPGLPVPRVTRLIHPRSTSECSLHGHCQVANSPNAKSGYLDPSKGR